MRKGLIFITLFLVTLLFLVNNVAAQSSTCNLDVTLVNQDPYPAIPGDYVEVLFQINGVQNPDCEGSNFEISLEYPFSIDPNDSTKKTLEGSTYYRDRKTDWIIPYDIRIDKNAVEKTYQIEAKYGPGSFSEGSYFSKKFNLTVEDIRTDFDLVIQESSGTDVSIAIANIGKNTANSLIIRIPEQENYGVSGTNGQMVGNLDSGDYTIVSFTLAQIGRGSDSSTLQVQLDYTDSIGERRSIIKNVDFISASPVGFNMTGNGQVPSGNFGNGNFQRGNFQAQQSTSVFKSIWFWLVIAILAGGSYWYYRKNPEKVKHLFSEIKSKLNKKSGSEKSSKGTPEWVSAERTKKK